MKQQLSLKKHRYNYAYYQYVAIIIQKCYFNTNHRFYKTLKFNTLQSTLKKQEKSDLILRNIFEKFAQEMRLK